MGRSPYADIVIADPSVAEHHAEIVTTDDGRVFVVDCGTGAGTWRLARDGAQPGWTPVRQSFVTRDEMLRLGDHECLVSDILGPVGPQPAVGGVRPPGREATRPGGRLSRDPMTGEIVRKRS